MRSGSPINFSLESTCNHVLFLVSRTIFSLVPTLLVVDIDWGGTMAQRILVVACLALSTLLSGLVPNRLYRKGSLAIQQNRP